MHSDRHWEREKDGVMPFPRRVFSTKMQLRERLPGERNLNVFAFVSWVGHRSGWNLPIVEIPGVPLEQVPADRQS
jgi:hypothetical protein